MESILWGCARLTPEMALAAIQEIRFWLHIMQFHSRFIRNEFDTEEEELFRYTDSLARSITALMEYVDSEDDAVAANDAERLIDEANRVVVPLRELKADMKEAVSECRVRTALPSGLFDHIRREADFFLGTINGLVGGPVPTRGDLEIPAPSSSASADLASLAPRSLIPGLIAQSPHCASEVLWDENLFFAEINAEHGPTMSLFFRPEVQESIADEARQLGEAIGKARNQLAQARTNGRPISDVKPLLEEYREATRPWIAFLEQLYSQVTKCAVPTGQVNFPVHLLEHMRNEAFYSMELVEMALRA